MSFKYIIFSDDVVLQLSKSCFKDFFLKPSSQGQNQKIKLKEVKMLTILLFRLKI